MSKKTDKAEKKAAKAEKKAAQVAKKATKAEKKALKAAKKADKAGKKEAKKAAKSGAAPIQAAQPASITKKAAVFGHPVRNLIVTALIGIVLGALFVVPQLQTIVYSYICYAAGGVLAVVGLVYIILYFVRKPVSGEYHYEFGCGLVAVLVGAYVALSNMLFPSSGMEITFAVIAKLIGIAIALDGILKIQYTLDLARMHYKKWWIALITSILGIAMGVGMAFFMDDINTLAYSMGFTPMTVLGAAYCLNGVLDLITMTVVAVRNHKANKAAALAEADEKVAAAAVLMTEPLAPAAEPEEEEPAEEEPEIEVEILPETQEESAPEMQAAPAEEPAFEPELPEPALATAMEPEE